MLIGLFFLKITTSGEEGRGRSHRRGDVESKLWTKVGVEVEIYYRICHRDGMLNARTWLVCEDVVVVGIGFVVGVEGRSEVVVGLRGQWRGRIHL